VLDRTNKCDLLPKTPSIRRRDQRYDRQGIEELLADIVQRIAPLTPGAGEAVLSRFSKRRRFRIALTPSMSDNPSSVFTQPVGGYSNVVSASANHLYLQSKPSLSHGGQGQGEGPM